MGAGPFPDGGEPDEHHHGNHGEADAPQPAAGGDDEFAAVVLDEEFVRSALIHEPTAVERMVSAAQARADAEAGRSRPLLGTDPEDGPGGPAGAPDSRESREFAIYGPYGPYGGALRPYRGTARWHRPIAWMLAVVMGIGMVALAFTAVYRGASGRDRTPAPPPASTGVDGGRLPTAGVDRGRTSSPEVLPSASADSEPPSAPAVQRGP